MSFVRRMTRSINSLIKSALLADVNAKVHNQHPQFFLSDIWLEYQHCDRVILSSVLQNVGYSLLKLVTIKRTSLKSSSAMYKLGESFRLLSAVPKHRMSGKEFHRGRH